MWFIWFWNLGVVLDFIFQLSGFYVGGRSGAGGRIFYVVQFWVELFFFSFLSVFLGYWDFFFRQLLSVYSFQSKLFSLVVFGVGVRFRLFLLVEQSNRATIAYLSDIGVVSMSFGKYLSGGFVQGIFFFFRWFFGFFDLYFVFRVRFRFWEGKLTQVRF